MSACINKPKYTIANKPRVYTRIELNLDPCIIQEENKSTN